MKCYILIFNIRSYLNDDYLNTISGLRRRGYTRAIINSFCNDVGATKAHNIVGMYKLYQTARTMLSTTSRRCMAALNPILVTITNFEDEQTKEGDSGMTYEVQNFPMDATLGSHTITLTSTIYIDASDFRLKDSSQYFGLAPDKAVGLKYYGGKIFSIR